MVGTNLLTEIEKLNDELAVHVADIKDTLNTFQYIEKDLENWASQDIGVELVTQYKGTNYLTSEILGHMEMTHQKFASFIEVQKVNNQNLNFGEEG